MNPKQAQQLGERLRQARHDHGMSAVDLAELTDVNDATIVRLENGKIATPAADKLARIAEALGLDVGDIFAMAGYGATSSLPTLPLYLRSKYDLPPDAMAQIEHFATKVAKRHGVSLSGPAPGEDEA